MANRARRGFAILFSISTATPVIAGEPVVGIGTVKDGDTLIVDGNTIRLHGIDAPEYSQKRGLWAGSFDHPAKWRQEH
jgi:endonuclease YncB( thermonuclease family)